MYCALLYFKISFNDGLAFTALLTKCHFHAKSARGPLSTVAPHPLARLTDDEGQVKMKFSHSSVMGSHM